MKILAIRGKNLASLEAEFALDFTVEPLLSAGIFAITGQTGSGKSTILDALCLALFDDTPRLSQADNAREGVIRDVRDTTIGQRDSRTILRRGASEGYAEADFLSLGGSRFRATWSVHRAGNRSNGALRPCTLRLVNLSTGEEATGQKRELLSRISALIGFTFEQFTRSVLLAQGDFAMFLKAGKHEKAALLEKLTGIEVYSRISTTIYEKCKQAEYDYTLLQQKIQEVELLTDEQTAALAAEKETVAQELDALKNVVSELDTKLKWMEQDERMREKIREAENSLTEVRQEMLAATPRYACMDQLDRAQEIRDVYNALQNGRKQLDEHLAGEARKKSEQESMAVRLKEISGSHEQLENKLKLWREEWERMRPEILRARSMDVQLTGLLSRLEEAGKEWKTARQAVQKTENLLQTLAKDIENARSALLRYEQWFGKRIVHQAMMPGMDLIIVLLDEAQTAQRQIDEQAAAAKECQTLLDAQNAERRTLELELEQLQAALPAEIAALRARLKDGEPCPVCGSMHHPVQGAVGEQRWKEEELNRNKRRVSDKIEKNIARTEMQKTRLTQLTAWLERDRKHLDDLFAKLANHLTTIPDWQTLFRQGILQDKLRQFARQWETCTRERAEAQQTASNQTTVLENEQKNLQEAVRLAEEKKKKYDDGAAALKSLQRERGQSLAGQPADAVEQSCLQREKELTEKLQAATERRQEILSRQEALNGAMTQIRAEIDRLSAGCAAQQKQMEDWINAAGDIATGEQLAALLSKSAAWIKTEKQYLHRLKEQATVTQATLDERRKNLAAHHALPLQPQPGETRHTLAEALSAQTAAGEQRQKRFTEITVTFARHGENQKRILRYGKELGEKRQLSENWKKLNALLGSADGWKFKAIAQGYTLDALLVYANKHLQELASRYELQRIPDTLALQVVDLDMLGEIRTVHSLSGGESFLLSLALALGLSALSSSRMKVESLFIDEGFGSLDIDTLRVAMDALERLQTQGRKIGIISHVAEMTERIAVQVRVVKTTSGKSSVQMN
ncbi:MAG: AAA family ATPase [Tannerella sp.]|jgi:exonuclease SbcC|nr:AAA family ATPase [Tannerella sp.]